MNRSGWTPEEREEYDSICTESWGVSASTRGRVAAFLERIHDARQAHRFFAGEVDAEMRRVGAARLLNRWHKANAQVTVSFDGRVLNKPRVIGTVRSDAEGRSFATQALFDFMTWGEIEEKIQEYAKQVNAYRANIALCLRLLDLHDAVPAAATPAQAAEALGTSVEAWLGEQAA